MNAADLWRLLAGIALFIYAMSVVEDALRQLAGRQFKKFLQRQTSHTARAIAGGTIVTAVLQSSSVVLLMILSFVGAGVMSMRNALAVTFGANLGTTASNWVVATLGFKVAFDAIAFPMLAAALAIKVVFPPNNNIRGLTHFVTGFALLFIGLEWMKLSASALVTHVDLSRYTHLSPYLFIPVGMAVTAIIQSSSAMVAITLTALYHGIIPLESAACIVIGAELGTTVKIVMGAMGGTPDKKRVSTGNFIFNLLEVVLASLLLYPLLDGIRRGLHVQDPLVALVTFQTVINLGTVIALYPFIGRFADLLEGMFQKNGRDMAVKYIHKGEQLATPESLKAASREVLRFVVHTVRFNTAVLEIDRSDGAVSWLANLKDFAFERTSKEEEYKKLKQLHGEILEYLVAMSASRLQPAEIEQAGKLITALRHAIHAAKNLKDIQHNIRDMDATGNDILNGEFTVITARERVFYATLMGMVKEIEQGATPHELAELQQQREPDYSLAVDRILALLREEKINDIDSSTLLNMHRELYSSHKALLMAVESLLPPQPAVNTA